MWEVWEVWGVRNFQKVDSTLPPVSAVPLSSDAYSAFQIDEAHRQNQNPVGTFHGTSLLWFTEMKTAVKKIKPENRLKL
ncbi:MAG: hypothetical protein F6K40_08105 [Okeania sp. SIO3I5]|uniref:hypothetical protein n=1 Tax=Okeania sp. SIO3I5 TaxID=2607805 RepID=UPI0013B9CB32|nr:hypothetical protein [Okeania sp. SIO3I5]NEQ36252.1 hypothetical protein [Okeania sp. SIO3I5]